MFTKKGHKLYNLFSLNKKPIINIGKLFLLRGTEEYARGTYIFMISKP